MFHLHSSNKSIGLFVAIRQDFEMLHAEILHVTTMKPPSYITGIIGRQITTKKILYILYIFCILFKNMVVIWAKSITIIVK